MLELKALTKRHGNALLLDAVSWQWPTVAQSDGVEVVALLGPSGAGKSTLLRIIAGLETATSGEVFWANRSLATVPVERRGFALMFQQFALFPHLNVRDNVAFGLRRAELNKTERDQRVQDALKLVGLTDFANSYPAQLSGGMRQRVCIARTLVMKPRLILLDEPFGALDAKVRKELRQWLRELHHKTGVTTIFVTHDQEEALSMSDRVCVMRESLCQRLRGLLPRWLRSMSGVRGRYVLSPRVSVPSCGPVPAQGEAL
mgnify:CR=1 FL=1